MRVILSLVVMKGWKVRQIDVNNVFLNGDLSEDVYMIQPEGFVSKEGYICKLNNALYGLKQVPREWYDKLKSCLTTWKFINSKADTSLFFKHDIRGMIIVLIYVDDILLTGPDLAFLKDFNTKLNKIFALKNLGLLAYFLDVQVCYTTHEFNIVQLPTPILWCDNQSVEELARNPILHYKSKHIELDVHYIRDKVLRNELDVRYIPTEEQVDDVLTKPLSFLNFNYFRSKLNVISRPLSLRGDVKEAHTCNYYFANGIIKRGS
ncbi:hypothetical protein KPL71_007625 [Citrus sinensis]|uniref:Uncharacterized protein n=1 Tax=Citrus sinensis TaxID=2711 RepID=A0ACB8M0K4_CITSI|nr:hypothetical protein KPL71_007625 [Citrus sinensis]